MSGILIISLIIGGIVALWLLISPQSVYWKTEAWQYKDPDANEPSDTAYSLSRISGGIMLVVIVVIVIWFASSSTQQKSEQQTHNDCQSVLLPELTTITDSGSVSESAMQGFATRHGLTLEVSTFHVLGYDPSATPGAPGSVVNVPVNQYIFKQGGRTILSWIDGPPYMSPTCSV